MAAEGSIPSTRPDLPEATSNKLPQWRGFNLLSKYSLENSNGPFLEDDFRMISELGFNFVRIPLDYRVWIKNGDWNQVDEAVLKEIDQAVEWGGKYKIHVCLNFHRAPGYCINPPQEKKTLWTDTDAQTVCARFWALFAKRYKDIPNSRLSFDLINEPLGADDATYTKVISLLVSAIRKEDPNRLILAEGNDVGRDPEPSLIPLRIAQSNRCFEPFGLTHYHASWVSESSSWPVPQWPSAMVTSYVYGPLKPNLHAPWVVEGAFEKESVLRLRVGVVSQASQLKIFADGKQIFDKKFTPGPGEGEWKESVFRKEWNIYQNPYDKDYTASIPSHTRRIELVLSEGDWLNFSELEIKPRDGSNSILIAPTNQDWGQKPTTLYLDGEGLPDPVKNTGVNDRQWLWNTTMAPWLQLQSHGVGLLVGEWGAYNQTPHDVTLRWMKDCLENWKEVGWGWALWNFRGDFGILDSGRKDVQYEDWEGHKLDREMLKLLQAY